MSNSNTEGFFNPFDPDSEQLLDNQTTSRSVSTAATGFSIVSDGNENVSASGNLNKIQFIGKDGINISLSSTSSTAKIIISAPNFSSGQSTLNSGISIGNGEQERLAYYSTTSNIDSASHLVYDPISQSLSVPLINVGSSNIQEKLIFLSSDATKGIEFEHGSYNNKIYSDSGAITVDAQGSKIILNSANSAGISFVDSYINSSYGLVINSPSPSSWYNFNNKPVSLKISAPTQSVSIAVGSDDFVIDKGTTTSSVGIGTANPSYRLHVVGEVSGTIYHGDGSNLTGITTSPAGANTEIQFNNSGDFGSSSDFTWNNSSKSLAVLGDIDLKNGNNLNIRNAGTSAHGISFYHTDPTSAFNYFNIEGNAGSGVVSYELPATSYKHKFLVGTDQRASFDNTGVEFNGEFLADNSTSASSISRLSFISGSNGPELLLDASGSLGGSGAKIVLKDGAAPAALSFPTLKASGGSLHLLADSGYGKSVRIGHTSGASTYGYLQYTFKNFSIGYADLTVQNDSPVLRVKNNQTTTFGMELDYQGAKIYSVKSYLPTGEIRHDTAGSSYYQTFHADGNRVLTLKGASGGTIEATGSLDLSGSSHSIAGSSIHMTGSVYASSSAGSSRIYLNSNGSLKPWIGTSANQLNIDAGSYGIYIKSQNGARQSARILNEKWNLGSAAEPTHTLHVRGDTKITGSLFVDGDGGANQITGSTYFSIPDNNASAFSVAGDGHNYINIDTTNGNEKIILQPNSGSIYPMLTLDNDYLQLYHSGYNHIYMFGNTMRIQGAPIQNQLYFANAYWQIKGHNNATLETTRIDQNANFYHRLTPASSSIFSIEEYDTAYNKVGDYLNIASSTDNISLSGSSIQMTGSTYFDDEVYIKTGASETPLTLQIGPSTNSILRFQGNGSNTLKYSVGSGGGWYHSFLSNNTERFLIGDNYSAFRNSVQVTGSLNVSTNITASGDISGSDAHFDNAFVNHLTSSDDVTIGGDGNFARIQLRRSDNAVVGEIYQNAGTTDIINNQGSGIRLMYQSTPLMHVKTTGVSLGYSQANLHQVTGSMHISGATTGHLTASGHVSASAFYGDGSNLTGIGGISSLVEDTAPQLGGTLDVNGQAISGSVISAISDTLELTGSKFLFDTTHTNDVGLVCDASNLTLRHGASSVTVKSSNIVSIGGGHLQSPSGVWVNGNGTGHYPINGQRWSFRANDTTGYYMYLGTDGSPKVAVTGSSMGIGTDTPSANLDVVGTVNVNGNEATIGPSAYFLSGSYDSSSTVFRAKIAGGFVYGQNVAGSLETGFNFGNGIYSRWTGAGGGGTWKVTARRGDMIHEWGYNDAQNANKSFIIRQWSSEPDFVNIESSSSQTHTLYADTSHTTDSQFLIRGTSSVDGFTDYLKINTSDDSIVSTGSAHFNVPDNNSNAFSVVADGQEFIKLDTTDSDEDLILRGYRSDLNYYSIGQSGNNAYINTYMGSGGTINTQLQNGSAHWRVRSYAGDTDNMLYVNYGGSAQGVIRSKIPAGSNHRFEVLNPSGNNIMRISGSGEIQITGSLSLYGTDDLTVETPTPGISFVDTTTSAHNFRVGVNNNNLKISIDNDGDQTRNANSDYDDIDTAVTMFAGANGYARFNINSTNQDHAFYVKDSVGSSTLSDPPSFVGHFVNVKDEENAGGIKITAGTSTSPSKPVPYLAAYDYNGTYVGGLEWSGTTFQLDQPSDSSLKDNIVPTEVNCLEQIKNIGVYSYDWKSGGHTEVGFVAQDLEKHIPDAVNNKEVKTITQQKLIPVLTRAVQQQQEIIEKLLKRVEELEKRSQ